MYKLEHFNRDLKIMLISSVPAGIALGIYYAVWVLYLKAAGFGSSVVGAFVFLETSVYSALMIPFGMASDRYGRKALALSGYFISLTSTVLLALSTSLALIYASAVLSGLGMALSVPVGSAWFADKSENVYEEAFSLSYAINQGSMAVGSFMGWIPEIMHGRGMDYLQAYRWTLLLVVALSAPSLLLLTLVKEGRRGERVRASRMFSNFNLNAYILLTLLSGLAGGFLAPLISYYFSVKYGVESGPIGTMYTIIYSLSTIAYFQAYPVASRLGLVKTILLGQSLALALTPLLALSPSFTVGGLIYVIRYLSLRLTSPLTSSLLMKITPAEYRGSIFSVYEFSYRMPYSISAELGGKMMEQNLDLPVYVNATVKGLYVLGLAWLLRRLRREGLTDVS